MTDGRTNDEGEEEEEEGAWKGMLKICRTA